MNQVKGNRFGMSKAAWIETILLFPLFFIGQLANTFLSLAVVAIGGEQVGAELTKTSTGVSIKVLSVDGFVLVRLFSTIATIALCLFFIKAVGRKSIGELGFCPKHGAKHYALGYLIGIGSFVLAILVGLVLGAYKCDRQSEKIKVCLFVVYCIAYSVQSFSEEVFFRSCLMGCWPKQQKTWASVIIASLFFSLAHITNDGYNVTAFFNLFLFSVFLCVLFLITDSIWICAACHSGWNFAQGVLFGLSVSGTKESASLFRFSDSGSPWINGGVFGPEAGIAVTIALIPCGIALLLYIKKGKISFKYENK